MEQRSTSLRSGSTKIAKLVPRDISENLGKLPPQALDLEEAVLGALMLEKNLLGDAGICYYRLEAGRFSAWRKMVLTR